MLLLFQEYARQQRHQEHEPYHPYRSAVERLFLSYHLTHVDADEEDRHAAPENLQMSYSLMYRGDILYQDAPHDHHHRQPAVDRMALDEFHVGRGKEIEHHRSRDVPEVELIMQPEPPVYGYFAKEIDPVPGASALERRDIEEAGYDEPGRVDAQITADEEMLGRRILHPREPETYSAEKEEHVYTDIAHSAKPEKGIFSRQCHMKEDDEQHGCSHQLAAKPADIRQFYIFYLHDFLLIFRVWNLLHQLGEEPSQADARYDVEEQTSIDVALTADRDEYLAGDRVAYEEGGGDAAHPL